MQAFYKLTNFMASFTWMLPHALEDLMYENCKHLKTRRTTGGGLENGFNSHMSDYTTRGDSHSNSETWVEVLTSFPRAQIYREF